MKKEILAEIDERLCDYTDFWHEPHARVCIMELTGLYKWIEENVKDEE